MASTLEDGSVFVLKWRLEISDDGMGLCEELSQQELIAVTIYFRKSLEDH